MYGWINASLEDLIIQRHGAKAWIEIKEDAQCTEYTNQFNRSVDYPDDTTFRLITSAAKFLQVSTALVIEELGANFLHFVRSHGYENTMRRQGSTFSEWLHNMNEPHRLLKSRFPSSSPPKFWVVPRANDNEVELHYYSTRNKGLYSSLVVGIVKEVAQFYFHLEARLEVLSAEMLSDSLFHGCWLVSTKPSNKPRLLPPISLGSTSQDTTEVLKCPFSGQSINMTHTKCQHSSDSVGYSPEASSLSPAMAVPSSSSSACPRHQQNATTQGDDDDAVKPTPSNSINTLGFSPKHVMQYFPFHIVINRKQQIIQLGDKLSKFFRRNFAHVSESVLLSNINRFFSIVSPPNSEFEWTSLQRLTDCDVELEVRDLMLNNTSLLFRGSLTIFESATDKNAAEDCIMFFINPDIKHLEEMDNIHLKLSDFPRHSFQRDLLLIREHLRSETDLAINLHELSNNLDQERRKSLQALRTKGIFVRYASHEIRTPLNITILGLSFLGEEILRLNHDNTSAIREVLMDVQRSCHSAVDILNDLLLYEKLESGGIFNLSCTEISVANFLRESIAAFKIQCQSSDIDLKVEQDDDTEHAVISIDKTKLGQVLRNFVSNGLKFTPKNGKITVSCHVVLPSSPLSDSAQTSSASSSSSSMMFVSQSSATLESDKKMFGNLPVIFAEDFPAEVNHALGYVRIAVSDTGPGIEEDDQKNLFQEFSQINADQLQKGQGSGLGLWIAKSITKMHGGRVGVASKIGVGSTFLADIPIVSFLTSPSRFDSFSSFQEDGTDSNNLSPMVIEQSQAVTIPTYTKHSPNSPTESSKRTTKRLRDVDYLPSSDEPDFQRMNSKIPGFSRSPPTTGPNVFPLSCTSSVESTSEQQSVMSQSNCDYRVMHQDLLGVLSKKNILIVDDIAMNRKIVRRLLQDKFFNIDEAENGLMAVQKVQEAHDNSTPYHVIMMDYFMPTMNGLEATRKIRELTGGPQTIILGVTGNGMQSDIDAFMQAGADQVLIKPLNLDSFFDILHQKLS